MCSFILIFAGSILLPVQTMAQSALAVTPVVFEVAPRERIWDGTVEAVNQGTVSAQTSGRVAEIFYDVNDFVPADAVIIRFTNTEQRAALDSANAALVEAQARLDEAGKEFVRISSMYENETVSRARYEQAEANSAAAQARLDASRSNVTAAKGATRTYGGTCALCRNRCATAHRSRRGGRTRSAGNEWSLVAIIKSQC